ncbi:MAG: hypothetical protein B7Z02_17155 [Rhodobacterales bacterium 32-67-9]|nr:MAG: hypothetical protein B7Z02_17155 [Rhodobacterales bacterium 32-67-9]
MPESELNHESPERTLVSGDLAAFSRISGVDLANVLRIARDRALVLGNAGLAPGWHDAGFALSDLSAGLAVIDLSGTGLADLAARGTTADLMGPGPSRTISFAGIPVVVEPKDDAVGLHVERGHLAYIWTWFAAVLREPSA